MPPIRSLFLRSWRHFAFAAALLLSGCGVPGAPLPPLLEIPAPIKDLDAVQVGASIHLVWTPPHLTTEGTRPRQFDHMAVYSAILPRDTPLSNFATQSRLLAAVKPGMDDQPISYELPVTAGYLHQKVFFAIKAVNRRGKDAGFSNVAAVEVADLPAIPYGLQATVTEKAILLRWSPAAVSVFGGPAPKDAGFQIFRSETQSPQPAEQIGVSQTTTYEDTAFAFGHTYAYFVRAFVRAGDSTAVTPPSITAEVTPRDVFPPAAPQNVRAVAEPGAVEIAWSPNSESDLAGYNVYRNSGGIFVKLNSQLLPIPIFRDTGVKPGEAYVYRVKAVDKDGNEGLPSEDSAVTSE